MPPPKKVLFVLSLCFSSTSNSHKECGSGSESRRSQAQGERREGSLGDRGLERDNGLAVFLKECFLSKVFRVQNERGRSQFRCAIME